MVEPIAVDQLAVALGFGDHELISLIGGGGKTTAMFALGRLLQGSTVLTTTTKMGRDQTGGHRVLLSPSDDELPAALGPDGTVVIWLAGDDHKAVGVSADSCDRWFHLGLADHVVVEADGSRHKPFKAPRPLEPVIPSRTTTLVACVGADALGRVITDQCQRPLRVAAVAGCSPYERLTPRRLATVLLSERGSRKGCPEGARYSVLINQVTDRHRAYVDELMAYLGTAAPVVCVAPFTEGLSIEPPCTEAL